MTESQSILMMKLGSCSASHERKAVSKKKLRLSEKIKKAFDMYPKVSASGKLNEVRVRQGAKLNRINMSKARSSDPKSYNKLLSSAAKETTKTHGKEGGSAWDLAYQRRINKGMSKVKKSTLGPNTSRITKTNTIKVLGKKVPISKRVFTSSWKSTPVSIDGKPVKKK